MATPSDLDCCLPYYILFELVEGGGGGGTFEPRGISPRTTPLVLLLVDPLAGALF